GRPPGRDCRSAGRRRGTGWSRRGRAPGPGLPARGSSSDPPSQNGNAVYLPDVIDTRCCPQEPFGRQASVEIGTPGSCLAVRNTILVWGGRTLGGEVSGVVGTF